MAILKRSFVGPHRAVNKGLHLAASPGYQALGLRVGSGHVTQLLPRGKLTSPRPTPEAGWDWQCHLLSCHIKVKLFQGTWCCRAWSPGGIPQLRHLLFAQNPVFFFLRGLCFFLKVKDPESYFPETM